MLHQSLPSGIMGHAEDWPGIEANAKGHILILKSSSPKWWVCWNRNEKFQFVLAVQYLDVVSHGSFHHLWTFNMLHKIIHDLSIYYKFIATHLWIDKITINENINTS